jgi:hypothetical protein
VDRCATMERLKRAVGPLLFLLFGLAGPAGCAILVFLTTLRPKPNRPSPVSSI